LPAMVLRDGTVCQVPSEDSLECHPLMKLPRLIVAKLQDEYHEDGMFDGLFDLDKSGDPEIFIDYWPDLIDCPKADRDDTCDSIKLVVYKKTGESYREYKTARAPTQGYAPGAWFLDESPRKAIIQTRCGGSSGACLYYLDWKKGTLVPISDDYFLEGKTTFQDIDHDGAAEIFISARVRDRTAEQGAALLHWTGDGYRVWWPTWKAPPYVMYACLANLDHDRTKGIVAPLLIPTQAFSTNPWTRYPCIANWKSGTSSMANGGSCKSRS
jgi:hypothetical protein